MAKKKKQPQKQVLKTLELTTLLVALDHLEEYGPSAVVADPYEKPAECVYLAYIGEAQLAALTARIPHVKVRFYMPTGPSIIRDVFNKAAIMHLMQFSFPRSKAYLPFVRALKSVPERYWRLVDADEKTIPRPKKDASKGKTKSKK